MSRAVETIATINSAVRTVLGLLVCGALGTGGYYAYNTYNAKDIAAQQTAKKLQDAEDALAKAKDDIATKDAEIERQVAEIKEKDERIAKLETARRLLKVDHRLAQLNVIDQETDENGELVSTVQFIELNPEGVAMDAPRVFRLTGEMIYIDGLSVTFRDEFVEQADLERGTSLFAFTRLFTDKQNPKDGYSLDEVFARPLAYGKGGKMSDFEKSIWDNFWSIANDEKKAGELGIANIHGNAPSIKPVKGNSYTIELRSLGWSQDQVRGENSGRGQLVVQRRGFVLEVVVDIALRRLPGKALPEMSDGTFYFPHWRGASCSGAGSGAADRTTDLRRGASVTTSSAPYISFN